MKTIVWGNYKGSVGKTTSTFQVALYFASKGQRVLLLDLDPQCSLSHICCQTIDPHESLESFKADKTFNYLLDIYTRLIKKNNDVDLKLLRSKTYNTGLVDVTNGAVREARDNLYFIPSSISYPGCRINDMARKMESRSDCIFLLKMLLDDLASTERFDFVFIDCPPTNNKLIESAFLSSDYYIVPTIIDEISANGVCDYISEIEKTYHKYDTNEEVGSILINKVFPQKTQLIGIFETLYKSRPYNKRNPEQILALNENIETMRIETRLSDVKYSSLQYTYNDVCAKHIFNAYIPHKDDRSTGESMPELTSHGQMSVKYLKLAGDIFSIIV